MECVLFHADGEPKLIRYSSRQEAGRFAIAHAKNGHRVELYVKQLTYSPGEPKVEVASFEKPE